MPTAMVAGNWKMNTTLAEAGELAKGIRDGAGGLAGVDIVLCPPHISLQVVAMVFPNPARFLAPPIHHCEGTPCPPPWLLAIGK